jgi:hypothetical protein
MRVVKNILLKIAHQYAKEVIVGESKKINFKLIKNQQQNIKYVFKLFK